MKIIESTLEPLFANNNDEFMKILKINYVKMIYKLVGIEWSDDPAKQQRVPIKKIKKRVSRQMFLFYSEGEAKVSGRKEKVKARKKIRAGFQGGRKKKEMC